MQVVILAAGLGSRLGDATADTPKALIEVAARPLIHYALRFARRAGAECVAVVGGFCFGDLQSFVTADDPGAEMVENPEYRKGNLLSLRAGLSAILPEAGFLLMNTDHVYRPSIADVVGKIVASAAELTAFCDFDRDLGADDMKVALDPDRRIRAIAKTLPDWDAGYVGMTFVPPSVARGYVAAIPEVLEKHGEAVHVESILDHFAKSGRPPAIGDISGHGWLEIDEPHERTRAEDTLARERWWA